MAIIQCSEHEFGLEFFSFFFQKLSSYKVRKIEKGKGNQEKLCTTFLSKKNAQSRRESCGSLRPTFLITNRFNKCCQLYQSIDQVKIDFCPMG